MGIVLQQTPWIGYTQLHELAADLRISQQIIQFRSGQVQEKKCCWHWIHMVKLINW